MEQSGVSDTLQYRREGVNQVNIGFQNVPNRGSKKGKGPKMGMYSAGRMVNRDFQINCQLPVMCGWTGSHTGVYRVPGPFCSSSLAYCLLPSCHEMSDKGQSRQELTEYA